MEKLHGKGHPDLDSFGARGLYVFNPGHHPGAFFQLYDARAVRVLSSVSLLRHEGRRYRNAGEGRELSLAFDFYPFRLGASTVDTDRAGRHKERIARFAPRPHELLFSEELLIEDVVDGALFHDFTSSPEW